MTFAHSCDGDPAPSAALDLGSNMFRLVVGMRDKSGSLKILGKWAEVVALAEGMLETGRIGEPPRARAEATLRRFRTEIARRAVVSVHAVGTGAFRGASNRQSVQESLASILGAPIEIIDGSREAALAVLGVASGHEPGRDFTLLDIGGVSTEVCATVNGRRESRSIEIGVITLFELAEREPVTLGTRLDYMVARAKKALEPLRVLAPSIEEICFAVGGAAVALVAHRDGTSYCSFTGDGRSMLHRSELDRLFLDYSKAPPDERAARIGVSQAHGNLIPAGYAILSTAMTILGVDAVVPSGRGVAEGLLFETTKAHEPPGR